MTTDSSVLLIFIDGLGIGDRLENNPLSFLDSPKPIGWFRGEDSNNFSDGVMVSTDPRLGVEGRPQSASGQTTILTGVNAPKLLGHHKQGFPNQSLRDVIAEHSIFLQLQQKCIEDIVFANAYTPRFFDSTPRWKSATTCAVEAAGMQFRRLPDLAGGHAVFHDFTNTSLRSHGYDVPAISPTEAAHRLGSIAAKHRFTLYEHFITDKIGHDQDFEKARKHLPQLVEFVGETVRSVDLETTTVILTSDHGNIEDLSVRNHTLNDVPTVVWGRRNREVVDRIKDLTDITPSIISLLA
jgi:2,3-bisphosphoglycerate-independent phosphoglycerate mutase